MKSPWIKYAVVATVVATAYFINVEVQTRLGEGVLEKMQLERHDLPEAFAKAQAENKLVLAGLSAIWCPTCRSLDKNVLSNPEVQAKIDEKYVFARIEYESAAGEAFMDRYDVRSVPTLLVLSPGGQRIAELPVTTYPEAFIPFL